jgi:vancomycin resistance protein YoaR
MSIPKEKLNKLLRSQKFLLSVAIILIVIFLVTFLNISNANKINWGMRISQTPVGGLYPREAEEVLKSSCQCFLKTNIPLNYQEFYWQASPEKMGVEINIPETLELAFEKGREKGKFLANIWWQVRSLMGYNLEPVWQINEEKLENFFRENLSLVHQPAKNASLAYNWQKQDFVITPSQAGIVVDKDKFKEVLKENIESFQQKPIQLSLTKDKPEVVESETKKACQDAQKILESAPFKLIIIEDKEKQEVDSIDKEALLSLMDFEAVPDPKNPFNKILGMTFPEEKIKDHLMSLVPLINQEPIDAQLTIRGNLVTVFALSREGTRLELKDSIVIISRGLLEGKKEIELKITKLLPKITTENIDNMGITSLLAKGISNFSGSPNSRIHNIKIGAAKFNGVLIKPGEEFSFNNTLGEIGPEQGYEPELVIKRDKTIPEYGGGLCQVSTTTFRAAVIAGLEVTQRYPHAFPVKYYNPQGFDATIYPPSPDLRFINNTPNNILIQTKINGYDLIFEFYGSNDGRKVEIDGPYQYDVNPDGSMKAKLSEKVYDKNNLLIIDKTFLSVYRSPALYPIEKNPLE